MKRIDLTGKTFGDLTVLSYAGDRRWNCKCLCGNETVASGNNLRRGLTHSCGHNNPKAFKDITGHVFGEWNVVKSVGKGYWECRCSCGTVKNVAGWHLRSGSSSSCGHNNTGCTAKGFKAVKDLTDIKYEEPLKPGDKIGDWTICDKVDSRYWRCICTCGSEKQVSDWALRTGKSNSCGMCKIDNLIGEQFGDWIVTDVGTQGKLQCLCACGSVREVRKADLVSGRSTSCGGTRHKLRNNITGEIFGKLQVLSYVGHGKYECQCSCGNITEVLGCNLLAGTTGSCGCSQHTHKFTKEVLESASVKLLIDTGNLPSTFELAQYIGINQGYLNKLLNDYNLRSIVDRSYTSQYERDILKIITEIDPDLEVITSDRKLLSRTICDKQEVDIYIPSKNLAIEFNGSYWHSSDFKDSRYHQYKTDACSSKGVRLIQIFEHEWINPDTRNKLECYLTQLIAGGKSVYARDCEVRELDKIEVNKFIDENHFQGKCGLNFAIGLTYKGEVVSCMTFGKPRFNSDYQYELIRYCSKIGVKVTGGASKIFKYFKENYNPKSVISYCDRSKFSGEVYNALGFENDGVTSPNYVWVSKDYNTVISRYQSQKNRLIELGYSDFGDTEDEIMINLGYIKVFDSGNIRFVINQFD